MSDTIETVSLINAKLVKETRSLNPFYVDLDGLKGHRIHPTDLIEGKPYAYILSEGPRLLGRRALLSFMWPKIETDSATAREFADLYAAVHYSQGVHYAVRASDEMIKGAAGHVGMNVDVIRGRSD